MTTAAGTAPDVLLSLDVILREACWDLGVARKVTAELSDTMFLEPPRHVLWQALTAVVASDPDRLGPEMVMGQVTRDRLPGWDDTCRYLTDISLDGSGSGTVGWHLTVVKEHLNRTRLLQLSDRLGQAAHGDLDQAVEMARTALARIDTRTTTKRATVADGFMDYLERLEQPDTTPTIATGLPDLDEVLAGGFRPGQLATVAAHTSGGKSVLLANFARHAAFRQDRRVTFHTLEMTEDEVLHRIVSAEARVNLKSLLVHDLDDPEVTRTHALVSRVLASDLLIDDTPGQTLAHINASAHERRPGLIIVDYIQIMQSIGKSESRQEEVAANARGLKLLGREQGAAVIIGAQLNRGPTSRSDTRPRESDIRESAGIAQNSDVVILIDRDPTDETFGTDGTLIVEKNRNGPKRDIPVTFSGHHSRFDNKYLPR